jgi:hypothetical protein
MAVLWITAVATIAHFLYSGLGFNPTDDGFTLAYARRLIDGQIPHRDFIMIRPALSPVLHAWEIPIGGPYVFWLSRFVFFVECAGIAWFGTLLISRGLGVAPAPIEQSAIALIAFIFGSYTFPPMAWHTIDGLLLCVLGLSLRLTGGPSIWGLAYALMGGAYLCKQSFFAVAPLSLWLFRDWRNLRCLAGVALPAVLYIGFIAVSEALRDAAQQLFSQTGIFRIGVRPYMSTRVSVGAAGGLLIGWLLSRVPAPRLPLVILGHGIGVAVVAGLFAWTTGRLLTDRLFSTSYVLFGLVCGTVMVCALRDHFSMSRETRMGLTVLLLAWSASLSIGGNAPVLTSGLLVAWLVTLGYRVIPRPGWRAAAIIGLSLAAVVAGHSARLHYVYRDRASDYLTEPLGGVLRGANLIRTNPNTRAFLADLNVAIGHARASGAGYAIVPDLAAHWVMSAQPNPLPIDWAQGVELSTPTLLRRVTDGIDWHRGRQVVLLQKVRADVLSEGFTPITTEPTGGPPWSPHVFYAVVAHVRSHLNKIGETQYFDLYR